MRPFEGKTGYVVMCAAMLSVMTGLVVYSPTLYRLFCAATGYGGTVRQSVARPPEADSDTARVTVRFDANVAPGLNWEFRPETRVVETRYDEPTKVYYTAKNNSDETVVARASFNITPYPAAPYFFKIECFCFTEEKLGPGESARMPLVLYLDSQMLEDKTASLYDEVTLSYTFYRQEDLSAEEIAAARDLSKGSKATDRALRKDESALFDNDAPRR